MYIWEIYWYYTDDSTMIIKINADTEDNCFEWFNQINHGGRTVSIVRFTRLT